MCVFKNQPLTSMRMSNNSSTICAIDGIYCAQDQCPFGMITNRFPINHAARRSDLRFCKSTAVLDGITMLAAARAGASPGLCGHGLVVTALPFTDITITR